MSAARCVIELLRSMEQMEPEQRQELAAQLASSDEPDGTFAGLATAIASMLAEREWQGSEPQP